MPALLPMSAMAACAPPAADADGWAVTAPESVGLDAERRGALVPWVEGGKEGGIHAVLVARHAKLVFEQYFSGADEHWGTPLGNDTAHSRDQLHDARSVTKSVVALVLGIALDRGLVKGGLDTPVFELLPQYDDLRTPEKGNIRLRHLLTMSAGLKWNEDIPYGDPGNSETQMDRAPDPARFVLSQDVVAPAGEVYNYSGGSAALIQAILKEVTGKSLDALGARPAFRAARHRAGRMGALPGHRRAGCCLRAAIVNAGLYRSPMQAWVPLVVLNRYVLAAAH